MRLSCPRSGGRCRLLGGFVRPAALLKSVLQLCLRATQMVPEFHPYLPRIAMVFVPLCGYLDRHVLLVTHVEISKLKTAGKFHSDFSSGCPVISGKIMRQKYSLNAPNYHSKHKHEPNPKYTPLTMLAGMTQSQSAMH